ncbi:MAG: hypothetical protein EOO53_15030 [Gammaproteobacteria bacterium]|nr:MAG: hypothetical protein EOO53_15030 [Gammaproteobacteria bacterium]
MRLIQISILLCLLSVKSFAQTELDPKEQNHERLYQVELIVFARNESNPQENWPSDIKLIYPENLLSVKADGNSPEGFSLLPANERLLNPQAATLARSGSYTLLYHQAWRQMIYGRKANIAISGGKTFNGHQELEGSISLSVAQYLKVQTNLWLTQFAPAGTNITDTWPELPNIPNTDISEADKSQGYLIKRIVKLSEVRTMRSSEVHYIDHPLLGVIVKIIPVESQTGKTN